MQPTEDKQPAKEELIAHIRESLKTHQEPYKLGAWEKFNEKQESKRTPIFWISRLGGVAAVLALCISLLLFNNNDAQKLEDKVVKTNPSNVTQGETATNGVDKETTDKEIALESEIVGDKAVVVASSFKNSAKRFNEEAIINSNSIDINGQSITNNTQVATNVAPNKQVTPNETIDKPIEQQIAAVAEPKTKTSIEEFLANETRNGEKNPEKFAKSTKSKWALSLMVAPSFGNSKDLNMGYGVSMGYNFSDKLSLITGISYNQMTASKDFPTTVGMSSILLGNNRSLAEISQKVSGLDIPLELKYSFNKSIYANVGVSAFAVLGQSRNNTFIQEVVIKGTANNTTSSTGGAAGASGPSTNDASASKGQFANSYIVNQKTVEKAALEDQNSVNYLGFYNFSVGFKRKVLKNHFLAIEPFVKLPIRQVTQDNLNLLGTGVRLKVDF